MKWFKYIKEIVFVYLIQYLFVIGISFIYLSSGNNELGVFLSKTGIIYMLILNIIIIIYLFKKNYLKEKKIRIIKCFPLILLGISIAVLMNMILFLFDKTNTVSDVSLYLIILSSGIIGPILEEILYRYLLLNRLLKDNNPKKSIIISTVIFGLLHGNIISIVYALILGFVLNIMYYKYKNILVPIAIHISANIIVIFLSSFNIYIFLLSIIALLLSILLILRDGLGNGKKSF